MDQSTTNKPLREVEIVVGIVERAGKILLIQRRDACPEFDKKWEFPGGKLEGGETKIDAVRREVMEETGLSIHHESYLGLHVHDWDLPEKIMRVHIHCFHCFAEDGMVRREEEKSYGFDWVTPHEARAYDTLDANADLLKHFFEKLNR